MGLGLSHVWPTRCPAPRLTSETTNLGSFRQAICRQAGGSTSLARPSCPIARTSDTAQCTQRSVAAHRSPDLPRDG